MKRRIVALLMVLSVILSFAPSALAEESTDLGSTPVQLDICDGSISIVSTEDTVTYAQGDKLYASTGGCIVTQRDTAAPTENRIHLSAETESSPEIKLTIVGVNIESAASPIYLDGAVKVILTLATENFLKCTGDSSSNGRAGIRVTQPSHLTIQGSGSLAVESTKGAGIGGGGARESGGTITINSGIVTVSSGNYGEGAGIGGDKGGEGGIITINGGTVTAQGGRYGAGIGGGKYYTGTIKSSNDGGTITINGGTVIAKGGLEGSGIGGGGTYGSGGIITITGGTVTATGGGYGAGIGGGSYSGNGGGGGGTVTISGGIVTATGGSSSGSTYSGAAGIGAGADGEGGTVSISNAQVTAKGAFCAIGGGTSDSQDGCESIHVGENAVLDLSKTKSKGDLCQEHIDIITQPVSAAAHSGHSLPYTVEAYGYSGLTYQWQVQNGSNWEDLVGETGVTLSILVSSETNGSSYRCAVTNAFGNIVYTDTVQNHILAFTKQPENVETGLNEIAALSIVSSFSDVTYRWQRSYDQENWTEVENQVSPTLVVVTTHSENGAYYRCIITAANGDWLASDAAQITVNSNAVTFSTDYYLEQADGSYALAERMTTESEVGVSVSAGEKTFDHYTENTEKGIHSGTVTADSSLVLSRYYDRCEYTLGFEMNGGAAVAPITAKHGSTIELPLTLSRYGYVFDGWYRDEELTEEAQLTVMPTEDTTVYAKWTPVGADRGVEYHINDITILGQGYQEEPTIPTGSFYAQVSVTNLCSETVDTLLLAGYDENGKMLDLFFLYADPQVGQTFILGALIDNINGETAELRAFMIPMLGGPMTPLSNSVSTTAN